MSITDTSTALDLTWSEQSAVSFTAGTLGTITECVTEVESRLKRGTLSSSTSPTSTEVQRWLIVAKQTLVEKKGFSFKRRYATASTTAGTYRYALPPDYNGGLTVLRDTSNDRRITIWLSDRFDTKYPDPSEESNNEPHVACVKDRELWLVPPPDGTYTLELEYDRSGDDNTTTDFSWLPEIERFRCCDFATWRAFLTLHMWQEANMYKQFWMEDIAEAIRVDGKRKFKSMNYQAINWQQWYAAKGSQNSDTD
jgi:hypothetical protein